MEVEEFKKLASVRAMEYGIDYDVAVNELLDMGIMGDEAMTLEEISNVFSITRERVRQIEQTALRKMKNPSNSKGLRAYMKTYYSGGYIDPAHRGEE